MILPVIAALSSSVVMKKMKVMQIFPSHFKDLWEEWELRGVVFVSLTLQILLICMGNRRKYIHFAWFRAVVWLAYLMADAVAIYALGIITNKLTKSNSQSVDAKTQLNAFWAPFLLLHLGGPDTITAYALEDNELWLRHLLSLVTQTAVTFYIFLMAWTELNMSALSVVVILAGLVKYGERVYVLWTASSEQFRDSIPDPPPNYSEILEQHKLMKAEGHDVMPHEVIEVCDGRVEYNVGGVNFSCPEEIHTREQLYKRKQGELLAARGLVNIFQRLFADLLLSFEDRDTSRAVLKDMDFLAAFKIIEIELGIVYDLLYTKAKIIHSKWGFTCRITGLFSICIVLVLFILIKDQHYSGADLYLTFILLAVAIFLEIYALVSLLFSDRTVCWLIKERKFAVLNFINWVQPLTKRRRWSDHMAQFSLLSSAIEEKHLPCHQILEFLHIDEKVEKPLYKHHEKVTNSLKQFITLYLNDLKIEMQSPQITSGSRVLEKYGKSDGWKWSMELEFDEKVLIWHIATELLCHPRDPDRCPRSYESHVNEDIKSRSEISKRLSRYMLYILVMYPMMLPTGIGRIKFRETYGEAMKFFSGFHKLSKPDPMVREDTDHNAPASAGNEAIRGHRKYAMKCAAFCVNAWQHMKNLTIAYTDHNASSSDENIGEGTDHNAPASASDEDIGEDTDHNASASDEDIDEATCHNASASASAEDIDEATCHNASASTSEDTGEDTEHNASASDEDTGEDTDHNASASDEDIGFCVSAWQQHMKNLLKRKVDLTIAYNELRDQVKTDLNLMVSKGDRSKYVLFHGCRLASQLEKIKFEQDKWMIISEVWLEMLCYAASKCKGSNHAQQLRRGGELLTHVWLMMAHFGLTDHFQILRAPAIVELIIQ